MQSNRTTPSRAAGVGTTLSLLLLGILLTLAALYLCLTQLRPSIEADLTDRVSDSLSSAGISGSGISVEGQDVTLTGSVADSATRDKAEKSAAETYGIARVFNQLVVDSNASTEKPEPTETEAALSKTDQPSPQTTLAANNDTGTPVADKPALVLESDPANSGSAEAEEALSPSTLDISVVEGQVSVQGIVPDIESIERIHDALAGKFGRANIEEDMSTYVGSATPTWLDGAIALIDQMDDIENPGLKITQNNAIITGLVSSETLGNTKKAQAEKLLGRYLEVSTELGLIKSSSKLPAPDLKPNRTINKRPASLKINSFNDGITLTGTVSSKREADTIRSRLNSIFDTGISDQLTIDDSVAKSDWLNEALTITDNVRSINDFTVSINSGQLMLSGNVNDRLLGRTVANAAADITGKKLNVVNNFTVRDSQPLALSGEELLAQELQKELASLNTKAIVFTSGQTTLTAEATQVLDQVARTINSYKGQVIEIAGHTDSTGDTLTNLELSKKRAIAVRDYLITKQVPSSRLRPIGYGETKPVADNETREGQTANRRIEFNLESR